MRVALIVVAVAACAEDVAQLEPITRPECDPAATCTRAISSDLAAAWPRHTIHHGLLGADGVDLADVDGDGFADVVTGWEQSSRVTVSLHPGAGCGCEVREPWPTVVMPERIGSVEHAIFADVDGDGRLDVVAGGEKQQLFVYFAPADPALLLNPLAWEFVEIMAARDVQRWIQLAFADVDGDGTRDVVAGGRVQPASVGYFTTRTPRDGTSWTWHPVGEVGCVFSLVPRDVDGDGDVDLVISDRDPLVPARPELLGARWLENPTWESHLIHPGGGARGLVTFIDVASHALIVGAANDTVSLSASVTTRDWRTFDARPIPQPANVGRYHDVERGDLDGDGREDLAFSYSHADGERSGVVWLRNAGSGRWDRGEISGPEGTKYDNLVLHDVDGDGDLDVVTSEHQSNSAPAEAQLGVIWYENPAPPRRLQR